MIYLRGIKKRATANSDEYPFTVPLIKGLQELTFDNPLTIISGDNGSGKTTLMEILALKLQAIGINNSSFAQQKRNSVKSCESSFTLIRSLTAKKNFYFSAEEFIKYIDWIEEEKSQARKAIKEIDEEYKSSSYAAMLAKQPFLNTLMDLESLYASTLSERSHGEGYLDFFDSRLISGGLYLLDEPESALSYENQYALAVKIREAAKDNCQFIIATHSPIIAAIPEATILEIKGNSLEPCSYEALDNVRFLEYFIKHRNKIFDF